MTKQVTSCIYCKYYQNAQYPYKNRVIGECHRYPRTEPITTVCAWCGEFKKGAKK